MRSREKKKRSRKRRKVARAKRSRKVEIDLDVLFAEEMLMEARMRNAAFELADKRKPRYIQ